jgi:hypothetical protein
MGNLLKLALSFSRAGRVAETSAGTLFVLLNGTWVTPPVSEGTLPGNRRVGRDGGRTGREAVVTLDDLRTV